MEQVETTVEELFVTPVDTGTNEDDSCTGRGTKRSHPDNTDEDNEDDLTAQCHWGMSVSMPSLSREELGRNPCALPSGCNWGVCPKCVRVLPHYEPDDCVMRGAIHNWGLRLYIWKEPEHS